MKTLCPINGFLSCAFRERFSKVLREVCFLPLLQKSFFLTVQTPGVSGHEAQIMTELWLWPSDNQAAMSKQVSFWWALPWVTPCLFTPDQTHSGCKTLPMGSVPFSILYRYLSFSRGQTAIQLFQRIEDVVGEAFNKIHFYSCLWNKEKYWSGYDRKLWFLDLLLAECVVTTCQSFKAYSMYLVHYGCLSLYLLDLL